MVYVKVLGIDDRGTVRLSMKVVDQTTGLEIPKPAPAEAAPPPAATAEPS
jgi:polyribonucleotide nucleotidyltransferase